MKKNNYICPPVLYKRPISKNNFGYNSLLQKCKSHIQEINIYANEEEQSSNYNLKEKVQTNNDNLKFKYLYSNFKHFKKLKLNMPFCNSSRYSAKNQIKKNKLKSNFNEIKDNNSLFFFEKDNNNKIFPNFNNNTCNISLNQHFYNIDYNNFANASNSLLKKDDIENNTEKIKNPQKYKNFLNIKNNYNFQTSNKCNKKKNIYLNLNNKILKPKKIKVITNSYDSFDNNSKNLFLKNAITNRNNKKKLINLNIYPNKCFINLNKTTELNDYSNLNRILTDRKIIPNLNLSNSNYTEKYIQFANSIDNPIFKYKKKIISRKSVNKNNDNNSHHFDMKNKIPIYNYKQQIISLNHSQEKIYEFNRYMNLKENKNNKYNSFVKDKLSPRMYKNQNQKISFNRFDKNNKISNNLPKFNKLLYNNINNSLNINDSYRINDSKNLSEKKQLSFNAAVNKCNDGLKIIAVKNNSNKTKFINNKANIFLNKLKNCINSNNRFKLINVTRKNISKEKFDRLNMTKPEEYITKRINNFSNNKQKLKKISLNKLIKNEKMKSKLNIMSSKGKKNAMNLKKIFIENLLTEGNRKLTITDTNLSSNRQINLTQNNNYIRNIKINKKKKIINDDKNIINTSLGNLLKKIRKVKYKDRKKDELQLNKKQINKSKVLINQTSSQIAISQRLNQPKFSNKVNIDNELSSNISEDSTKTKENNEFMEQSKKLSDYIKDYYSKNHNYPQTNLNFYRIGRVIGQGGFAKVNLGLNVLTGRVVAIKSFNKNIKTKGGDKINMDKILYEINLMRKLNHQNITKILETFEDEQYYFIIMEYINGGNLFSYVKKRRKLSEKVAKFIFRQIILGIQHIHSQLIVHRDIKLENILIDMNNNIKICDFGIGIVLSSENQPLYSHCGTPVYIAPEIILSTKEKGYNGFPVDIWSAGIALYIMISGKLPFNLNESHNDFDNLDEDNSKGKNKKLKYEIIHKEPKYLENISDELRDLLKGLLNKDPKKRLTCEEILNHPWLDDIHSHKIHLFSKDERNLLSQTYVDFRKKKCDDLIENFTLSNLFKDKNNEEKYNCETKSSLLAPFNSINYEYFKIEFNKNKKVTKDEFEDCKNKKIIIENDLLNFSNKAKELNFQYELNNNKEVDNGVLILSKSNIESISSSFSNANSKNNDKLINFNFANNEMNNISDERLKNILSQIEKLGYNREYVIKSLKNNFLNHATTIYFLLLNYEKI